MNWENSNDQQRNLRVVNDEEIKLNLYQWFQIPSEQVLRSLRYPPWGGTIPPQTGGSGLYQTEGPNVLALACDLYEEKNHIIS